MNVRRVPLPVALLLSPLLLVLMPLRFVLKKVLKRTESESHEWHMLHDPEYREAYEYYYELHRTNLAGFHDTKRYRALQRKDNALNRL